MLHALAAAQGSEAGRAGTRAARAQVEEWQGRQREMAMKQGYVRTLLGRQRALPDARQRGPAQARGGPGRPTARGAGQAAPGLGCGEARQKQPPVSVLAAAAVWPPSQSGAPGPPRVPRFPLCLGSHVTAFGCAPAFAASCAMLLCRHAGCHTGHSAGSRHGQEQGAGPGNVADLRP